MKTSFVTLATKVASRNLIHSSTKMREDGDLRKLLKSQIARKGIFVSFELCPINSCKDTYERLFTEFNKFSPLFYALTCHKGNTFECLSSELIKTFPKNTLLHLVVNDLSRSDVENILKNALGLGITNIFALRGDLEINNDDFPRAVDLVTFIRNRFNNEFCICVAGYPEMHPNSSSKESDLRHLKAKVDAGADFIITQIFFEANVFTDFVKDCRAIDIDVPIIPGIFPIPTYNSLERMQRICRVKVPEKILSTLHPIKHNDEATSRYGIELATNIIKNILASGAAHGFHLFTLNRTSLATEICDRMNLSYQFSTEIRDKEKSF